MGRKGKYYTNVKPNLELVKAMCRDGATDEEIYTRLGITSSTFYEYKKKYSEFSETLKESKELIDIKVENALLKRALGYNYVETTKKIVLNKTTDKYELRVTKEVTKEMQPDTTAQIFWLKNRKPTEWRDRQDRNNEDSLTKLDKLLEEQRDA